MKRFNKSSLHVFDQRAIRVMLGIRLAVKSQEEKGKWS